jgi:polyphosphate kinase
MSVPRDAIAEVERTGLVDDVVPTDVAPEVPDPEPARSGPQLPVDRFASRELSWLDFNARVLAQAEDRKLPLLERVKFLAIFASNLDEFYMVRVAGLKRRLEAGLAVADAAGLSTRGLLSRISKRTQELVERHAHAFLDEVEPALAAAGVRIVHWDALDAGEQRRLGTYFRDQVFPVLTPLAVDPAHPFPYISGLSLNLAVSVREPDGSVERFARVKVPNNVPRFVPAEGDDAEETLYLPMEELIAAHLPMLFPGMEVREHHLFRVTRNADIEVEEDRDEDLLQAMEKELMRRRFGPAVRLEVAETMSEHVLELLREELDIHPADVLRVPGLLDLASLWQIYDTDRPDLKERPFVPATAPRFVEGDTPKSVFATLREGDILVHHPYESFSTSVQRFIEKAAADPLVLAIKQTLYRAGGQSPIVDALIDAARAGKQVVVLVEVKARFDEQANIRWAKELEQAGCHVVYGLVGLKTHCKTALVVRQESGGIRRYCHIGTGNYNTKTARQYEDLGLFTADPAVGADLTDLFNVLTGYSRHTEYRTLLVAPHGLRRGLLELIETEIEHARAGREARIRIKVNHLVDEQTIDALYRASQAGVRVELLVRTFNSVKAGVPGLSDNIRVRSILGRFLEHSRVVSVLNGGEPVYLMGSSDLMHRNLDRRIEVLLRISDPVVRMHLAEMLDSAFADDVAAWDLQPDGSWKRNPGVPGQPLRDYQQDLMRRLAGRDGGE